ncbi:anti-sigma factor family protein [Sneathiella chinensis]|uniref:Anti-sigma factor n=1 Tax=Sneathiella chinensis TaxID=349750 RepID=A0ABQ5U928_9PROT|nr:hypothetical protein [Sneathiella chinensis]GLQ07001.1 anti-sigma factor [Sneathiella chinensis]
MAITDTEWEQLNAYLDGELDEQSHVAFERLLTVRPDLRIEQKRLLALKTGLGAMGRMDMAPIPEEQPSRPRQPFRDKLPVRPSVRRWAAAVLLASAIGASWLVWDGMIDTAPHKTPADYHTAFSGKTYLLPETGPRLMVSSVGNTRFTIPDLYASALVLADVVLDTEDGRDVVAMHYRGRNGCQLTLVAAQQPGGTDAPASATLAGLRTADWRHGEFTFHMMASGMDPERFQTILDYAKEETGRNAEPLEPLRMAMQETYAKSRPCA